MQTHERILTLPPERRFATGLRREPSRNAPDRIPPLQTPSDFGGSARVRPAVTFLSGGHPKIAQRFNAGFSANSQVPQRRQKKSHKSNKSPSKLSNMQKGEARTGNEEGRM